MILVHVRYPRQSTGALARLLQLPRKRTRLQRGKQLVVLLE